MLTIYRSEKRKPGNNYLQYTFHKEIKKVYTILKDFESFLPKHKNGYSISFIGGVAPHVTLLEVGLCKNTSKLYYKYELTGDVQPTLVYCDSLSDIYMFILDMGSC